MDGHQFLRQRPALAASRRSALSALLAIPAAIPLTTVVAKKKRCAPCKRRKKGKCKKNKPDGTACPQGACQRGRCLPVTRAFTSPGAFTFAAPRAGTVTIDAFGAGGGQGGAGGTG
ncbi:MAG: hypothetical protein JNM64_19905, partial [Chloroflexia bacterium]|nr:hypothetical protein [Chloroflexia bacterium]